MKYNLKGEVWMDTYARFHPPMQREPLQALYENGMNGTIVVHSVDEDNDYEYKFKGCMNFDEFVNAVTYVMIIDYKKHGLMSKLARDYMPVYQHRQYNYVLEYLRKHGFDGCSKVNRGCQ